MCWTVSRIVRFFCGTGKTTRRFFKKLWKEMVIDDYQWFAIHKAEEATRQDFIRLLKAGKNIGIVSEAGCPGVADPGQYLIAAAQEAGILIKPLVGPSSILLALMASGMNGQCFQFHGYLPIDSLERKIRSKIWNRIHCAETVRRFLSKHLTAIIPF